jgi:hypothetical protein
MHFVRDSVLAVVLLVGLLGGVAAHKVHYKVRYGFEMYAGTQQLRTSCLDTWHPAVTLWSTVHECLQQGGCRLDLPLHPEAD